MNTKSLMDISDRDLHWLATHELNLMDGEIIQIERNKISTTLFWRGVHRSGSIVVLKNAVCIIFGDRTLYLTQKSVDYLRDRGYEICNDFVYNQDLRFDV